MSLSVTDIFGILTRLNKTIEVTIYGGGWSDKWIVKLQYHNEAAGTHVMTESKDKEFAIALSTAWYKLERALETGADPHALIPPVEHAQIEAPIEESSYDR